MFFCFTIPLTTKTRCVLPLVHQIMLRIFSLRRKKKTSEIHTDLRNFWSKGRESNPTKILVYQYFFAFVAVFVAELILKF